jgi:hypothetical protein
MDNNTKKKILKRGGGAAVLLLGALQFLPVDRSNPPVEKEVDAPPAVRDVLRRACYDCHSHETVWPWYSRVAPVSFLVAHDVAEGREELNFSRWDFADAAVESRVRRRVWREVEEGEMPLWFYVPLHPAARLNAADKEALRAWALASMAPATTAGPARSTEDVR